MPHQCTTCGRTFPDGSKEMLSGCPDCGGNKFQFRPEGAPTSDQPGSAQPSSDQPSSDQPSSDQPSSDQPSSDRPSSQSDRPTASNEPKSSDPDSVNSTADPQSTEPQSTESQSDHSSVSPGQSAGSPPAKSSAESPTPGSSNEDDTEHVRERSEEDVAQASARSDVVSPDELDRASREVDTRSDPDVSSSEVPEEDRPDIGELRDELNEQFESIRIVSPGKYELNLMELYDRQEYIISLQEDGRYVIEMPDAWGISDE